MLRALYNSRSAMSAEQEKLDAISNNIANVNTEGYKREDVDFQDLVYETLNRKGYPVSNSTNKDPLTGTGVKASPWIRDNSQGRLENTGIGTDIAIDGEGYFKVITGDKSPAYERSGSFNINANGNIVDKNGNYLEINFTPDGQARLADEGGFKLNNFQIKEDGTVLLKQGNNLNEIGKINVYNVIGDDSMTSIGENLYVPKPGTNVFTVGNSDLLQGFIESSNVDIGKEMTDMIMAQRAFEMGSTGVKTADEMWGLINNMRGR